MSGSVRIIDRVRSQGEPGASPTDFTRSAIRDQWRRAMGREPLQRNVDEDRC